MMSRARIILAGGLAGYPQAGGHWSVFIHYLLGLAALGHDVYWLEIFSSGGNRVEDERLLRILWRRFKYYGFEDRIFVVYVDAQRPEALCFGAFGMAEQ